MIKMTGEINIKELFVQKYLPLIDSGLENVGEYSADLFQRACLWIRREIFIGMGIDLFVILLCILLLNKCYKYFTGDEYDQFSGKTSIFGIASALLGFFLIFGLIDFFMYLYHLPQAIFLPEVYIYNSLVR